MENEKRIVDNIHAIKYNAVYISYSDVWVLLHE